MTTQITTRDIKQAATLKAAGLPVTVSKQSCAPRCLYSTPDNATARKLLDAYERGDILDLSHKALMTAYTSLLAASKSLQAGRLGGLGGLGGLV
jgi:hypothetical protein